MQRAALCILGAFLFTCGVLAQTDEDYAGTMAELRAEREEQLRSPDGWLTLAGLFWLSPGENRFGSDPENSITLSAEGVPAWAGTFVYDGETVTLKTAPDAEIRLNDEPVQRRRLRDDGDEEPDVLTLGRLSLYVIERGDRHAVRVKDPESIRLAEFRGLRYFPLDPAYRFDAVFKPFDEPREVSIGTVIGTTLTLLAPGSVEFTIDGETYSLEPLVSDPDDTSLWFIFQDLTSGKETYGFRYLYVDLKDGRVDLDLNKAQNPPCAFTPYATCPLPQRENRLDVRIEAGERIYIGH
jgi:hypothetical protein